MHFWSAYGSGSGSDAGSGSGSGSGSGRAFSCGGTFGSGSSSTLGSEARRRSHISSSSAMYTHAHALHAQTGSKPRRSVPV